MKKLLNFTFLLFVFTLMTTAFTCSKTQTNNLTNKGQTPTENLTNKEQKPIMIADNYPDAWRTVDSLDRERLPKSALEQVEKIYKRARSENNYPQVVKSVIYRSKYVSQLEEEGMAKVIANWEEEIKGADSPTKQILQSVLAQVVDSYRQNNSWRLRNRTETQDFDNQDIKTWSSEQLTDYSLKLHLASLEDSNVLKAQPFNEFSAITTNGNAEKLRPTLYDFLAHRAIDFFMNERNYLTQPAYKFELDNPGIFAYTNEFINTEFPTKDETSFKKITLDLFQDLLRFRMEKENTDALADVELKRLKFVYANAVLRDKDDLYLSALEKLYSTHEEDKTAGEILYNIGLWYETKGAAYNADEPTKSGILFKNGLKTALSYYEQVLVKYPKTPGATHSSVAINRLKRKNFALAAEEVNLANEAILVSLSYKNTDKVYVKVISWNEERQEKLIKILQNRRGQDDSQVAEYLNSLEAQQNANYDLQGTEDLRQHTTEISFAGLAFGQYMIIAGSDANFGVNKNFLSYTNIIVSNLGYWAETGNGNGDNRNFFTAYNRKTGAAESGVKVEFYRSEYNSISRKSEYKKASETKSDKDGFFSSNVPINGRNGSSYRLKLTKGKDILYLRNSHYDNQHRDRNQVNQTIQFFTDRAIYRPGQTVYFKGLILSKDKDRMPSIVPNKKVQVVFKDANWQEISKVDLTSNEYGTFNGTFSTPTGGLLGVMRIEVTNMGSKGIRVEEYKRPKFEVKFEPIKGSFALNDSVKIEGKGLAFAGNNIDGAGVQYRVTRQARYPYRPYWYWRGGNQPSSPEMEITNGTTKTDAEGKFSVTFKAIPDAGIPAKDKPVFTYTVTADVTDITGETHTSTQSVQVGYVALKASAEIKDEIEAQDLKSIVLSTENLNGEFEAAQGTFELNLLKAPQRTFINRYWERPEFKTIKKDDFLKHFPHLAYDEEDKAQNWKVERSVISTNFDTNKSKEIAVGKIKLVPGKYRAILKTKDKNGTPIEWEKLVTIIDLEANKIALPEVAWHFKKDTNHEPGETAKVYFGTAEKDLKVLFSVAKDKRIVSRKWLTVNNLLSEKIKIEEGDRGNFSYHYNYARHNRSSNAANLIKVPWSNKDLQIEYTTFRDKLLPGQDEEWQIKISGQKGDKVAAEMLATMYDASLDAFAKNSFSLNPYPTYGYSSLGMSSAGYRQIGMSPLWRTWQEQLTIYPIYKTYHNLDLFGFRLNERRFNYQGAIMMSANAGRGSRSNKKMSAPAPSAMEMDDSMETMDQTTNDGAGTLRDVDNSELNPYRGNKFEQKINEDKTVATSENAPLQIRENLNETVFFYPDLMTDKEGNIIVKFKMNEALTRWKFLGIATTKDLQIGTTEKEIVTQKELMVVPNAPRFFRENDEIEFTAKVVNLSEKDLSGTANIELLNPLNGEPVFVDANFSQDFTVKAGQSARLAWYFNVPEVSDVPVIQHTVSAKAGNKSDAERSVRPVLTNRMLVTETMPLPVRGGQEKTFTFKSMQEKSSSPTLAHEGVTLEFTSNPAWYAVQALPYLMEYPYECTEQIFSRYYANSLASSVANSHPKVKTVFEQWRDREPDALLSNLSKNQELKTALLEETPWVLNAQSEEMQKRNIGLLFDLNKMSNEQAVALRKLKERQLASGGFAWFPGGRDNWYITQYLVEGLGHLDKLGVADVTQNAGTWQMVQKAVKYCDDRMLEYYEEIEKAVKKGNDKWENDHLSSIAMHYLYARTFFLQNLDAQANKGDSKVQSDKKFIALNGKSQKVFDYFVSQADTHWQGKNIYNQGMIALALHRINKNETPTKLVKSFKERALNNDELGMYFKGESGYNWYELPIERHALLIEVMDDVAQDAKAVDDMKTWLLKNKQTSHWKTTKATASAVYALLATGDNWLLETAPVEVGFDIAKDNKFNAQIKEAQSNAEAGTGYFKTRFDGDEVTNAMTNVTVKNPNKSVAWGAMYWQYFEQLDKITTFEDTPLQIKKQLFKVILTDTGEKITPVNEGDKLSPGDKLKVRIELRTDRSMEYVHMKDGRASGFEPMNVLSSYKYQGGLGYYESTRDASTDFFFSRLPKGTHVFEYPIRVVHNGNFSNGITTVQCMYAPEFTSHSEGVRVEVE